MQHCHRPTQVGGGYDASKSGSVGAGFTHGCRASIPRTLKNQVEFHYLLLHGLCVCCIPKFRVVKALTEWAAAVTRALFRNSYINMA